MGEEYRVAELIVISIFSIVLLIIILTYLFNIVHEERTKAANRIKRAIEEYFNRLVRGHHQFALKDIPKKWLKLDLLLPIFVKLDKAFHINEWKQVRNHYLQDLLMPLAQKDAVSRLWTRRFMAAEIFSFSADKSNIPFVDKLVNDRVPLVYLNALGAALNCQSERGINDIITRMIDERHITQTVYLQAFKHAPADTQSIIAARLEKETNPYGRATCYTILNEYAHLKAKVNYQHDITSQNLALKIPAIKYMANIDKHESIPKLLTLLNDNEWEVKVTALNCLNRMQAKQAIKGITSCLRDPEWWVRLAAAEALKNMGDEGIAILKAQDPKVDQYAYDAAQHVLAMK